MDEGLALAPEVEAAASLIRLGWSRREENHRRGLRWLSAAERGRMRTGWREERLRSRMPMEWGDE